MSVTMDDRYDGFNDYVHAFDPQNVLEDHVFRQAVARSSYGRRPKSTAIHQLPSAAPATMTATGRLTPNINRAGLTSSRVRSSLGTMGGMVVRSSISASRAVNDPTIPINAVQAAGYTSAGRGSTFDPMRMSAATKSSEQSNEQKCHQMEQKVNKLLIESIMAWKDGDFKKGLSKAKDAGRTERAVVKMREQLSVVEQLNLDLTFTALLNLAHQYTANNLLNEALNTYQVIVKNKMFTNSGRLKVNIGNIHFKKRDYTTAIKYYRMALDQVPNSQKYTRIKILNNIGVAFVKCGEFDEACSTFEHCMDEFAEYSTGLNLILAAYFLNDLDNMKAAFQRLLEIPVRIDDEPKYTDGTNQGDDEDFLLTQLLRNDSLRDWERKRRRDAERAIFVGVRMISSLIVPTSKGYEWCVEAIKQSVYAPLALELEMNKAVELLRQGDLQSATQAFLAFNNKESKVSGAAANNLALISLYHGLPKLDDAIQYCEQALAADRYSSSALVNRGNIFYLIGDLDKATQFYKESLSNEASCVQALYNLGYTYRLQGKLESALEAFYKLHNILLNNVQVLCQLAAIYESLEDTAQAIELYTQASSLAPTDPAILQKLAIIYDKEGDKSQALQCNFDSYRHFPSNIATIEWLGAHYIDAQFPEKAVKYFEKASIMQPKEIKWQLMMASCLRRSGNYQSAFELYRKIHNKFPENIDCLRFLVRICTDLRMPEAKDYIAKLNNAERVQQLRIQREADSTHGKRSSAHNNSASSQNRPSSRSLLRTSSARLMLSNEDEYQAPQQDMALIDYTYEDPVGPVPQRPKTGRRKENEQLEIFDDELFDESLLPE